MGSTKYPLIPPPQGSHPDLPHPGQPAPMRPDEYTGTALPNVTSFNFKGIEPPASLYLQRDDLITLAAFNGNNSVTVRFTLRFLRVPEPTGGQPSDGGVGRTVGSILEHGIVETVQRDIVLVPNTLQTAVVQNLAEGYLIGLGVSCQPNVERGQVFARAFISRGTGGFLTVSTPLFANYVTGFGSAGWPYDRNSSPEERPGWKHSLQWGTPAAGADVSFTLFTTQRLRVESGQATFVASGAAANRNIQVVVDDGANIVYTATVPTVVTAGQTVTLIMTGGTSQQGVIATNMMVPLPAPLTMTGAWRIRTLTQNIQAGDQWSAAWLNVEEWLGGN